MNKYYLLVPILGWHSAIQADTVQEAYDELVKGKLNVKRICNTTNKRITFNYMTEQGVTVYGAKVAHESLVDLEELEDYNE